jgi:enediyne biosynthesis protein E4
VVAFHSTGVVRAGMGIDAADYDGSGRPSLIIGNFSNEMMALYHNEGRGLFIDDAPRSAIGRATLLTLTFGCFFFDYDLDGRPDIMAVNGHVADDIEKVQSRVTYRQRPHLFHNTGQGRFEAVTEAAGPALNVPMVARGAAYGDFDGDGDLDVAIAVNNGPARLLRNESDAAANVLRVRTIGTASNRDGIGARVEVSVGGGPKMWQIVKTGSSYLSQSELPLTFGLGRAGAIDEVRVTWPSGRVDVTGRINANQSIAIREGAGVVETVAIPRGNTGTTGNIK